MREIIFRGKSIDSGEWLYGDYAVPTGLYHANIFTKENYLEGVAVDEETVGQYTGLTDKNGRRIFEGDIIADKNELFSVRWSEKISGFVAVGEHRMQPSMNQGTMKYCEVVGNIYDNDESMQNTEQPTQADSWLMSRFQKQE